MYTNKTIKLCKITILLILKKHSCKKYSAIIITSFSNTQQDSNFLAILCFGMEPPVLTNDFSNASPEVILYVRIVGWSVTATNHQINILSHHFFNFVAKYFTSGLIECLDGGIRVDNDGRCGQRIDDLSLLHEFRHFPARSSGHTFRDGSHKLLSAVRERALGHGQTDWQNRAVAQLADSVARFSNHRGFTSLCVLRKIVIVIVPVGIRHEHADVLPNQVCHFVFEEFRSLFVAVLDDTVWIDAKHRFQQAFKNREGFAFIHGVGFVTLQHLEHSSERVSRTCLGLRDRQLEGKISAVLVLTNHLSCLSNHFGGSRLEVILNVRIMTSSIHARHQNIHIFTKDLKKGEMSFYESLKKKKKIEPLFLCSQRFFLRLD